MKGKTQEETLQYEFKFTWLPEKEPEGENEKLIYFIDAYRVTNKKIYLEKFYLLACDIAKAFIEKEKKQKGFYLDDLDKEEKAINASSYMVEQIIKRPFLFFNRPTSYLYLRVKKELYYRRKIDEIVFFCDMESLKL